MIRSLTSWSVGLAAACLFCIPALGEVLRVPADFATIQAAVTAAVDDDIILLSPGRYHEAVVIHNKRITLRGEGGANATILDGSDLATTIVTLTWNSSFQNMGELDGLTLTGGKHGAVTVDGVAIIRNCVFIDNALPSPPFSYGSALTLGNDSQVIDCAFVGNDHCAVALGDSHATFLRCTFERNPNRAVRNRDGSPTFTDCRFIDNNSPEDGGAMYNFTTLGVADPFFVGCTFIGNVAGGDSNPRNGGVLWGFGLSRPSFIKCRFERNRASEGGVIRNLGPTERFIDCEFIANSADWGGVLHRISGASTHIERCRFEDNTAGVGGALSIGHASDNGEPSIIDSTFRNNTATTAGAIALQTHSPTIVNCVFDGNFAAVQGGALSTSNASPHVINCTLVRNVAREGWPGSPPGAIFNSGFGSLHIVNSILWNNSPNQITDEPDAGTRIDHCLIQGGWRGKGSANLDADPLFVDLKVGDVRLRRGSPAIDAGDDSAVPAAILTDINGLARVVDGDGDGVAQVDLGAHEFVPTCQADIEPGPAGDGIVNAADLLTVITSWGACGDPGNCPADIAPPGGDDVVDVSDLLAVITSWGACP